MNHTAALRPTPFLQWLTDFNVRFRFKFILPQRRLARVDGLKLDISRLSSYMKNNVLEGRYEKQERRMVEKHLTPQDRVLELGGAIGYISLYCQCILGIRQYTTVEANPATAEILRKNHALNGSSAPVWNLAAAQEDGELDLDIGAEFWTNSIVTSSGGRKVRVPCLSLPSILAKLTYSPTTLIADIEGAEQYLDFAAIPKDLTKIIIELHPDMIGEAKVREIQANLAHLGFEQVEEEAGTFVYLRGGH